MYSVHWTQSKTLTYSRNFIDVRYFKFTEYPNRNISSYNEYIVI